MDEDMCYHYFYDGHCEEECPLYNKCPDVKKADEQQEIHQVEVSDTVKEKH